MRISVNKVIQRGKPWTDPDFPPEFESLCDPAVDKSDPHKFSQLEWKRASECYDDAQVFRDGIHPNDINQGQLGDCYFLAVLSSMAEFPE